MRHRQADIVVLRAFAALLCAGPVVSSHRHRSNVGLFVLSIDPQQPLRCCNVEILLLRHRKSGRWRAQYRLLRKPEGGI